MPAQVFTPPPLGVGMLWRPELAALAEDGRIALDAVARDAQRLWRPGSAGQLLDAPTLLRSPGLPLATATEHCPHQIEAWHKAVEGLRPAWVSAPLGFLLAAGLAPDGGVAHTGLLLPPLQCPASVLTAVRRIEQLR